jgi:hypothetical protein
MIDIVSPQSPHASACMALGACEYLRRRAYLVYQSYGCFLVDPTVVSFKLGSGNPLVPKPLDPHFTSFRVRALQLSQKYRDFLSDLGSGKYAWSWPSWQLFEDFLDSVAELELEHLMHGAPCPRFY